MVLMIYRNVKNHIRKKYIFLIDYICLLVIKSNSSSDIIILRLDAIGDFILFCDSAKEYKNLFPGQKIILLANHTWADLAIQLPYWDHVISINIYKFETNIFYRCKTIVNLRKNIYKKLIHPTFSRDYLVSDSIVQMINAELKIGFDGDYSNISKDEKRVSDNWYDDLIMSNDGLMMELNRNAAFLRSLGHENFKSSIPDISHILHEVNNPLEQAEDYFVIFPFASWYGKEWPIDKFVSLIAKLSERYAMACVLCGGPNDVDSAQKIIGKSTVNIIDYTGKTDLMSLAKIIQSSQLLVSNDTSAIHIAAAVCTKSVCILGGGHYGRFLPYVFDSDNKSCAPETVIYNMDCFGCNWNCPYIKDDRSSVPCINNIKVDSVLRICEKLLNDKAVFI